MLQSETLYNVPLEAVYGMNEELNEVPPREKSCVCGAYLGKEGCIIVCGRIGTDRNKVVAELGIEAKFIELYC